MLNHSTIAPRVALQGKPGFPEGHHNNPQPGFDPARLVLIILLVDALPGGVKSLPNTLGPRSKRHLDLLPLRLPGVASGIRRMQETLADPRATETARRFAETNLPIWRDRYDRACADLEEWLEGPKGDASHA